MSIEYQQKMAAGSHDAKLAARLRELEHERRCLRAGAPPSLPSDIPPPEVPVKKPKERHKQRKLSDSDVRDIRRRVAAARAAGSKRGLNAVLADEYGVSRGTISDILCKRIYANVPDEEVEA